MLKLIALTLLGLLLGLASAGAGRYQLTRKAASSYNGAIFRTFSSSTNCKKNINAASSYNLQKDQCTDIDGGAFSLGSQHYGVKIQKCYKDKVIVELYDDLSCNNFIQKVEFPKSASCASGYGVFINFKCV